MINAVWGVVRAGRVELLERLDLPEGAKVLVTLLPEEEASFWLHASEPSLGAIWDNTEDDVYAQLLEK